MKTKIPSVVAALFAVLLLVSTPNPARGVIVLSNLGQPTDVAFPADAGTWYAVGFVTSAHPGGWNLLGATLDMATAGNNSGNFFVSIYDASGAGGAPGAVVGNLSGSANPATAGQYAYSAGPGLSLASATPYWLAAGVTSGSGSYHWNTVGSVAETGAWSFSPNSLGFYFSPSWVAGSGGWNFKFALEAEPVGGAAVPEPGTWAAAALLACGAVLVRAKRRKPSTSQP